ncbi:conserved hypothetical protein [Neospora caninum Liverpool]|uniref:Uncharacterized protein n=1 Tax=Neospora caninum (strain Liverpool) TaxID=572307 RepID=F0VIP8_NEOCL|nr:conserved hypothetical protein [Neospora caninum Liverpool]CBZ53609.1 conserved hypothetical protein [Neospora caninum Liverpool]CEL67599.1 TPA: hypothetical protein BN1204_033960 [Neospora caninum Liverpool]|eukprot:XP_003883641.1 conserved hypothetical protein [Neospora caninum Liverpool]
MYLSGPRFEYQVRPGLPKRQHWGSPRELFVPQKPTLSGPGLHLPATSHTQAGPESHARLWANSFPVTQCPDLISQVSFVASHPSVTTHNPLVQRSPVGRAKQACHAPRFPATDHFFGYKALQGKDGNVRAVFQRWMEHHPPATHKDAQNFQQRNKAALQSGATTPKKVSAWRRSNPVLRARPQTSSRPVSTRPVGNDPFFSYGHRNRAQPGVAPLIQNIYGVEHVQELARKYEAQQSIRKAEAKQTWRVKLTKAAYGHSLGRCRRYQEVCSVRPPHEKCSLLQQQTAEPNGRSDGAVSQFKIKKFVKTPPRITTRWKQCPTREISE